nr:immunoglobulin light chain junction region [Macaca mulatta]
DYYCLIWHNNDGLF